MKTLTKEEIATKHGIINGFTIHSIPSLAQRNLFEAMQEYSDQQTANLKAINEKQAELIEALMTYSTHVKIMWNQDKNDDESKELMLALYKEVKKLNSELKELTDKID